MYCVGGITCHSSGRRLHFIHPKTYETAQLLTVLWQVQGGIFTGQSKLHLAVLVKKKKRACNVAPGLSGRVRIAMQDESDGLDRKAKQQVLDSDFASMIQVRAITARFLSRTSRVGNGTLSCRLLLTVEAFKANSLIACICIYEVYFWSCLKRLSIEKKTSFRTLENVTSWCVQY